MATSYIYQLTWTLKCIQQNRYCAKQQLQLKSIVTVRRYGNFQHVNHVEVLAEDIWNGFSPNESRVWTLG